MKIVIEIPKSVKQTFDKATEEDIYGTYYDYNSFIGRAIKNGTPLPKGHGKLIDADELIKQLEVLANIEWNIQVGSSKGLEDAIDIVDDAPTIIEADEKSEE